MHRARTRCSCCTAAPGHQHDKSDDALGMIKANTHCEITKQVYDTNQIFEMNVSFGLDASAYEAIDYMTLLSDSLETIGTTKTLKYVTNADNKYNEINSPCRSSQLKLSEKMNCFNRLVFERSVLLEDLCFDCLSDFVKVSHYSQRKYETFAHDYEESIANLEGASGSKLERGANDMDERVALGLLDDVKQLQAEYENLLQQEKRQDDQLRDLQFQEQSYDVQIIELMKSLNALQYQGEDEANQLQDVFTTSVTAEQEIHLLSSPHFTPLFKLELLAVPRSLMHNMQFVHSTLPVCSGPHEIVLLAVNGFRVAYSPIVECELHWPEINAGWAGLCTALACYQHVLEATTALGDAHGAKGGRTDISGGGALYSYSYDLVCLRHTAVLVEAPRRNRSNSSRGHSSRNKEQRLSFCLNYSSTSIRGSRIEYTKAILALAIVVVEVAVLNCRLDVMTSFSKLSFLHSHAKSLKVEASGDHGLHMEVLAWPSLDLLLSLPQLRSEADVRDLTNDVLLAVHCILEDSSAAINKFSNTSHL